MSIFSDIGNAFASIGGAADSLFTSDEERLKFRNDLVQLEMKVASEFMQLEKAKMELQAQALEGVNKLAAAETQSDSQFTRTYRPAILCGMFGLILLNYLGLLPQPVPEIFITIFGTSFGVVGTARSAEKIVSKVIRKKDPSP